MKYLFVPLIVFLLSCSSDTSESDSSTTAKEEVAEVPVVIDSLALNTDSTTIDWERYLDQKATTKKGKLFGKNVDISIGAMQLNMNGSVDATGGNISTADNVPTSGRLTFSMSTLKFAEEAGEGLFNIKDYPESELVFNSFEALEGDGASNYSASASLTIQGHAKDYTIPLAITLEDSNVLIEGSFVINTLDFPLREDAAKSIVNKDEITVFLKLVY